MARMACDLFVRVTSSICKSASAEFAMNYRCRLSFKSWF